MVSQIFRASHLVARKLREFLDFRARNFKNWFVSSLDAGVGRAADPQKSDFYKMPIVGLLRMKKGTRNRNYEYFFDVLLFAQ